jgi:uncharacterized SAM-binding protein YcdF (DUF218 family)
MFLYLSKLIPLLLYPLGLACVLILVSLILVWKRPRLASTLLTLSLLILWIGSNGWTATWLVRSLEWQNLPPADLPTAEAIVVLGGATKPQVTPRPWVDVSEAGDRVLHAIRLYQMGKAPLIIVSGGRIDWKGSGPSESGDITKMMTTFGVPASVILQDPTSLNTYQNAVNVKQILQARNIQRVLLVTSALHMPRSLAIFRKQGINAIAAPTDFQVTEQDLQELSSSTEAIILNLMPDADRLATISRALKEYLGLVVYRLRGWL